MEDRTARSSAPTEFEEKTATESRQKSALLPNWRSFLVLLPGLCTLVLWEIAAWQWPSVARLVSQPSRDCARYCRGRGYWDDLAALRCDAKRNGGGLRDRRHHRRRCSAFCADA